MEGFDSIILRVNSFSYIASGHWENCRFILLLLPFFSAFGLSMGIKPWGAFNPKPWGEPFGLSLGT